jgi:hypothetical protein
VQVGTAFRHVVRGNYFGKIPKFPGTSLGFWELPTPFFLKLEYSEPSPLQVEFYAKQRARAANTRVVALLAFGCQNNKPKTGRPFASLVLFILPISKEASPASILGRIWCDVSSRTCLAGLSIFCFTLVCCVLCEFCESLLALEWCKSWGVAGV